MFATIRRFRERRAARNRYHAHHQFAQLLLWNTDYSDRDRRVEDLGCLIHTTGEMAREIAICGSDLTDDDGHTPEAEWHKVEASLLTLIEAAETGDYGGVELDETASRLYRDHKIKSIVGCIAEETDLREKGFLLLALADEALEHVGHLVDIVAILAHAYLTSSGMSSGEAHHVVWGIPVAR